MDNLDKIHKRQIARLLAHLKRTGQYSVELEKDLKRSFGYTFQDIHDAVNYGNDKEQSNGSGRQQ